MASTIALKIFLLLLSENSRQIKMHPHSEPIEHASEVLERICRAICSHIPGDRELTFVFVLITATDFKTSLNYLWSLPNSHVYLSSEHIALRDNDREVTLS